MQIDVLLKPNGEDGYTATSGKPFDVTAHGATEEETLAHLERLVKDELKNGAKVVAIQVGEPDKNEPNPWLAIAGIFEDDDDFDEWQEEIRKYRRERDAEDAAL